MKERRQYKRLSDELPVRLEAITSSKIRVLYVKTKNISAGGIFVYTKEASYIPEDTRFIIDLTIPSGSIKELTDVKSLMECTGTLARSTSEGIAIQCDEECEIMSLRGS